MALRRPSTTGQTPLGAIPSDVLDRLLAIDGDAPSAEERVMLAQAVRADLGAAAIELDRLVFRRLCGLGESLERIQETQQALKEMLERYQLGPWHPAVFLALVETTEPARALVVHGTARRVVGIAADVDARALAVGDEVYLDDDGGLVVAKSPFGLAPATETATFERTLADGRLLVRFRDELAVATPTAVLAGTALVRGDLVRWDHQMGLALERLEQPREERCFLADVPDLTRADVGGQDENLDRLFGALTSVLVDPDRARRYGLDGRQCVLMEGPPGSGKTLLARVVAAEIRRLTGKRCRIAVVKPGELSSMWVGESERNLRNLFAALREAAYDGYAVLFLDEVEALGHIRGGAAAHHDDRLLAALLTEIDGFVAQGDRIAVIAATNRKDTVDPALLERLSDVELHVGRPDMAGARRIFEIHLAPELPYAIERAALIDGVVSRLYAPNGDNRLAVLRFRDGTSRTIGIRDLMSGRLIQQICRSARRSAFRRDLEGGAVGIAAADLDDAVAFAITKLAGTVTPRNCRAYLADLPQDLDVVSVDPMVRRVPRRHAYVNAA
jgi:ATP-dependent 26S proteasome regulatory subunit